MNKPELIGLEVITPDGRGSILSLHNRGVVVYLNKKSYQQIMIGRQHGAELHYFYSYDEVEIIKGQYNLISNRQPTKAITDEKKFIRNR